MPRVRIGDFKASGRGLVQLVHPEFGPDVLTDSEDYLIASAVTALGNAIYQKLGNPRYRDASVPWPVEPRMETALRACLREYSGMATERIAQFLVRCGREDAGILAALDPWDGFAFRLRGEGTTADEVDGWLRGAGMDPLSAAARGELAGWIANPRACLHADGEILHALFGRRYVSVGLDADTDFPANHELFGQLVNSVGIEPPVTDLRQEFSDEGVRATVFFRHAGSDHRFDLNGDWQVADIEGVVRNAERLLASLGRSERAFRWRANAAHWGLVGDFTVAEPKAFGALLERLRLPVA